MDSTRFRFGLFEFCLTNHELRREGILIRLQSQPAQVLELLIQHAGQVVSREDLHRVVWGNRTFVDFDSGLNFCIAQIRSALCDDSATPRYIRTVPKRGYQFIAPVETVSEPPRSPMEPSTRKWRSSVPRVIAVSVALALFVGLAFASGYWWRSQQSSKYPPIVAVARFDNETDNPGITSFSDALSDNIVEQLTSWSQGRYKVIGNAQTLRLPRDQRDLKTIASALHARYIVLGQVQNRGAQARILAHLIRLPDQTHMWVARMDRTLTDPLRVESEVARTVAAQFSPLLVGDASGHPSPPARSRE